MLVGEYIIEIEDAQGNPTGETVRSTATGHPIRGEEIKLPDGRIFVVYRVLHEDEPDAYSERHYTTARVFVRPAAAQDRHLAPVASTRDVTRGFIEPLALPGGFDGPPLRSVILPPFLLAVIVIHAYQEQATYYRRCRRAAGRLIREGHGWILQTLTTDDLWTISRRAKRHENELANACLIRGCGEIIPPSPGPCERPSEPTPIQREAPPPARRAHRPTLRLVCP
jgi:hypothetical protein